MYIIYNETKYPCRCKPAPVAINYFDLPEDFPAPVAGTIQLYADDGFLLREDSVDAYLRQTFADGHLQLTNVPEPEPGPEPEPDDTPTIPDRIATLEAENRMLTQQVEALSGQNDFLEECIVEMAGVVYA